MQNVKFSRRTLLRGLGYGGVFCSGLCNVLYAQSMPRITRVAMFGYANGSQYQSEPTGGETDFVLKPHMAPLEAVRSDLLVFKNLTLKRDPGNAHRSASYSVFGLGARTSIDQEFAKFLKDTTPLQSLEIAVGQTSGDGGVIPGLSQIDGKFIPSAKNPLSAYQRVADRIAAGAPTPGSGAPMTTPDAAEQALLRRQSVLDFIKDDVKSFRGRLGPEEGAKMDFYLESLRGLEREIGSNIPTETPVSACVRADAPMISKDTKMNDMPQHSRLYLDTVAMAFACNVTRIASVMWGGGENNEAVKFNDIDISAWHSVSHGDPDGAAGQQITRLQAYFAGEFLYFVQKLKSMGDGDVSLLDNTAAVLCTQNGSSQLGSGQNFAETDHPPQHAPFVVAGSCGGAWRTGRLLDAGGRNHNDVYASIARALGMDVTTVGRPEWCKGPLIA